MNGFKAASFPSEGQTSKEVLAGKYPRLELPPEMLEMIFAPSGNLLQLTLVCPAFNGIILKSSLLTRKLKVKWTGSLAQTSCLLQSDRKYGGLHLYRGDPNGWQQVESFIEKHKRTLTDLDIDRNVRLEPRQYFECFSTLCGNLKILKARDLPEEIAFMGVLEFPKLEELTWSSSNRFVLQGWKTPKLKKFTYTRSSRLESRSLETITKNATIRFLRDQPQLQNLVILNDSYARAFFEAAFFSQFSFNLVSFKIYAHLRSQNIFPFLRSQRQSLKVLSLGLRWVEEADLRKILTLELEELELSTDMYQSMGTSTVENKTIKKLTLRMQHDLYRPRSEISVSVIESCPNVETLSFKHFSISKALSNAIASKMTKLKNFYLTKSSFDFPPSQMDQYPSVDTFSAKYVDEKLSKIFLAANPQLRVIKIFP